MGWVEGEGRHLGLERTCQGLALLFDHNCCVCVCALGGGGKVDGEKGTAS